MRLRERVALAMIFLLLVIVVTKFIIPNLKGLNGQQPERQLTTTNVSCPVQAEAPHSSLPPLPPVPATVVIPGTTFPSAFIVNANTKRLTGDPQGFKVWVKIMNPEGEEVQCHVVATVIFDTPHKGETSQHACPLLDLLPSEGKGTDWKIWVKRDQIYWPIKAITVQPMAFWPG